MPVIMFEIGEKHRMRRAIEILEIIPSYGNLAKGDYFIRFKSADDVVEKRQFLA